ncbi:hypothetical protein CLOSTHATH_03962, partial [Hungatella hathewayi DSM 13479]
PRRRFKRKRNQDFIQTIRVHAVPARSINSAAAVRWYRRL